MPSDSVRLSEQQIAKITDWSANPAKYRTSDFDDSPAREYVSALLADREALLTELRLWQNACAVAVGGETIHDT